MAYAGVYFVDLFGDGHHYGHIAVYLDGLVHGASAPFVVELFCHLRKNATKRRAFEWCRVDKSTQLLKCNLVW